MDPKDIQVFLDGLEVLVRGDESRLPLLCQGSPILPCALKTVDKGKKDLIWSDTNFKGAESGCC